jgi:hypothetical protein
MDAGTSLERQFGASPLRQPPGQAGLLTRTGGVLTDAAVCPVGVFRQADAGFRNASTKGPHDAGAKAAGWQGKPLVLRAEGDFAVQVGSTDQLFIHGGKFLVRIAEENIDRHGFRSEFLQLLQQADMKRAIPGEDGLLTKPVLRLGVHIHDEDGLSGARHGWTKAKKRIIAGILQRGGKQHQYSSQRRQRRPAEAEPLWSGESTEEGLGQVGHDAANRIARAAQKLNVNFAVKVRWRGSSPRRFSGFSR